MLLTRDGTSKISDVGFANILSNTHLSTNEAAFTFAWAAPEVIYLRFAWLKYAKDCTLAGPHCVAAAEVGVRDSSQSCPGCVHFGLSRVQLLLYPALAHSRTKYAGLTNPME